MASKITLKLSCKIAMHYIKLYNFCIKFFFRNAYFLKIFKRSETHDTLYIEIYIYLDLKVDVPICTYLEEQIAVEMV